MNATADVREATNAGMLFWELVIDSEAIETKRARVSGGYLYRSRVLSDESKPDTVSVIQTYVPDIV